MRRCGWNVTLAGLGGSAEASRDHSRRERSELPEFRGLAGPYWFFFYSFDCNEPMRSTHGATGQDAKFWLAPVALAWNHGFSAGELNDVRRLVVINEQAIIEAWHEHCGQR